MSQPSEIPAHTLSIAPMMDWSDRHYRAFMRLITKRTLLYTEMITAAAVVHGDRGRLLGYSAVEQPLALQLGGSDPTLLAEAARIGEGFGYSEINLNVGCPSPRVQSGCFGAALMLEPALVADCVAAMVLAVQVPVTVKCRIGVDQQNTDETLPHFIKTVAEAGCTTFVIHARKAWLDGLSPKQNREIPPLQYDLVQQIKQKFQNLTIVLNGGLTSLEQAQTDVTTLALDGAMIGRAAYHNPWEFVAADPQFFGAPAPVQSRLQVVEGLIEYVRAEQANGTRLHDITRHVLGLFAGQAGARHWRRTLSTKGPRAGAGSEVITEAASFLLEQA